MISSYVCGGQLGRRKQVYYIMEEIALAKCEICGKTKAFGNTVSHSHRATKRTFRPNLQRTLVYEGGQRRRLVVCAKCLKRMHLS